MNCYNDTILQQEYTLIIKYNYNIYWDMLCLLLIGIDFFECFIYHYEINYRQITIRIPCIFTQLP